jgi:uncharacterized alkaline shock family protein YloU
MNEEPLISQDVLARYAGDAASEVTGIVALAESPLHRGRAVEIVESDGAVDLKVHVELEWGRSAPEVGKRAERRVREYVERMTKKRVGSVEIVVEHVSAPPKRR